MSNKGIFYSIITLMFLVPIILYIVSYLDMSGAGMDYSATRMTGDKLSAYVDSIDNDLPRALEIIGKQSMAASLIYIDTSGVPLDDAGARITELMMNNTIYGNTVNLSRSTIMDWAGATVAKGKRYGFSANVSVHNVSIAAYDSFHIMLSAEIDVNATESSGKMRIDKKYYENIILSIEGFSDPLYTLSTNGLLTRTIRQANITVSGASALDAAVAQNLYMTSEDGPSFLDRMEGRLTSSDKYKSQTTNTIGIETIVYIPDLQLVGLPMKQAQSTVDHYYFSSSTYSGSNVNGSSYSWLRLDAQHAAFYGVSLGS